MSEREEKHEQERAPAESKWEASNKQSEAGLAGVEQRKLDWRTRDHQKKKKKKDGLPLQEESTSEALFEAEAERLQI